MSDAPRLIKHLDLTDKEIDLLKNWENELDSICPFYELSRGLPWEEKEKKFCARICDRIFPRTAREKICPGSCGHEDAYSDEEIMDAIEAQLIQAEIEEEEARANAPC